MRKFFWENFQEHFWETFSERHFFEKQPQRSSVVTLLETANNTLPTENFMQGKDGVKD
jgi:hypothetical protein